MIVTIRAAHTASAPANPANSRPRIPRRRARGPCGRDRGRDRGRGRRLTRRRGSSRPDRRPDQLGLAQLPAQRVHHQPHRVGERVGVRVPGLLQQVLGAHHPAFRPHQQFQDGQFLRGEPDVGARPRHASAVGVEAEVGEGQYGRERDRAAPVQGPQPGHQFGEVEGLGEVVVGPQGQPFHLVAEAARRGEHQDPAARVEGLQAPATPRRRGPPGGPGPGPPRRSRGRPAGRGRSARRARRRRPWPRGAARSPGPAPCTPRPPPPVRARRRPVPFLVPVPAARPVPGRSRRFPGGAGPSGYQSTHMTGV